MNMGQGFAERGMEMGLRLAEKRMEMEERLGRDWDRRWDQDWDQDRRRDSHRQNNRGNYDSRLEPIRREQPIQTVYFFKGGKTADSSVVQSSLMTNSFIQPLDLKLTSSPSPL